MTTTTTPSAAQRAKGGAVVVLASQMASHLLHLVSAITLARLLPESAFGENAIVASVSSGLIMMTDVGVHAGIIKSSRDDDTFLRTAWTMSVLRGVTVVVVACLLAWPAARFYGEPRLLWLVPLGAVPSLFFCAESASLLSLIRAVRPLKPALLGLLAQATALVVSVAVAVATRDIIALIVGSIVAAAVRFALTHTMLPGPRMRFAWERATLDEIWTFGRFVIISTFMGYLAVRWDIFALGKLEGMAILGVYAIANQLTAVPHAMSTSAATQVLAPVLSDTWRDAPATFNDALDRARRAYLPVAMLLFLGAATLAPAFFTVAYPTGYAMAGVMAQALMVQAFFDFLQEASSRVFIAKGDGRGLAIGNSAKLVGTIAFTSTGLWLWGFWGFVWGNALGCLVGIITVGVRLRQQDAPNVLTHDMRAAVVFLLLLAVSCGAPLVLEHTTNIPAAWTTLIMCGVVCGPLAVLTIRLLRARRRARSE